MKKISISLTILILWTLFMSCGNTTKETPEVVIIEKSTMPEESELHKQTWMGFVANDYIWETRQIAEVKRNLALIAKFGDKEVDENAFKIVQKEFPNRVIEQIAIDGIASGGGSIHCATQQEPKL